MDNEFLTTYQYYNFKEPNDKQENGNLKRICLTQYLITSHNIGYTCDTSDAIDENLTEYSNVIDDQSGINNYATSLEVYTGNKRQLNILQWKNELKISNVKNMIDNIKCCSSNDIERKDLQEFLKVSTKQFLNFPEKHSNVNVFTGNRSPYTNYCKESNLNATKNVLHQNTVDQFTNASKIPATNFNTENNSFQDQNIQKSGPWITDPRQVNNYDQHTKPPVRESNSLGFKTAKDELQDQNLLKNSSRSVDTRQNMLPEARKKTLGTRRGVHSKFVPPIKNFDDQDESMQCRSNSDSEWKSDSIVDERLKNIEPRMVELIKSEIMNSTSNITWNDIAGLEFAKMVIKEVVVLPMLRPDIFTGLRRPPKGILLFGPPGTGKTLIGKCIASQSGSTFFSISASSLTSKWIGDGEKMVRAMFAVARTYQPAVIFIDEIDSLLSQRNETEHESTRRLKTEFLVQLDGAATDSEDRILVIGATNRPKELDEAARRRFVKRLYIPLPDNAARLEIVQNLMKNEKHELTEDDITKIAELSDGFSGADMMNLCSEAALGPIRGIDFNQFQNISTGQLRPTTMQDFEAALTRVRATVSPDDLNHYVEWNKTFGTGNYY